MTPMGERVGTCMTKTRKLWIMILMGFVLGFVITVSEPDPQVLAEQVPSVPNLILIIAVAVGVGMIPRGGACCVCFLELRCRPCLWFFHLVVFALAFFVPDSFLAVAFDSGGVTTGPMTVPFIMALGVGIAAIRK